MVERKRKNWELLGFKCSNRDGKVNVKGEREREGMDLIQRGLIEISPATITTTTITTTIGSKREGTTSSTAPRRTNGEKRQQQDDQEQEHRRMIQQQDSK